MILAGITISQLTQNGLFEKAQLAKQKSENAEKLQNETLEEYRNTIGEYINGTRNTGVISNYSEQETQIGTWIDGKKLYRKVIKTQVERTTEQHISFSTYGINNVDFVMLEYQCILDSGTFHPIERNGYISGFCMTTEECIIYKDNGNYYGDCEMYIILNYTKTTD